MDRIRAQAPPESSESPGILFIHGCLIKGGIMKVVNRTWLAGFVVSWIGMIVLRPAALAAGFFSDDFESYTLPTNVVDLGQGWGASSNSVAVEAGVVVSNEVTTKAINLTPRQFVTNGVGETASRIWTESWLRMDAFMTPDTVPFVNTAAVFMVSFSTNNGYLYVCNPTSFVWEVCSTDATNGPAATITTGAWVRLSILKDYGNHTIHIFLNDRLIRKDLSFINTNASAYNTLKFDGSADQGAYIDNVFVSNSTPSGLVSDSDGDARPDAEELTLFGSLTAWAGSTITASVTNGVGGTVSPASVAAITWQGQAGFAMTAAVAYVVDRAWTNGAVAQTYSHLQVRTASFTWSDIRADGELAVGFVYNGVRFVGVGRDYETLAAAIAAAQAGDTVIVSDGAYGESVSISSNLTLVGTNVTGLTGFTVATGVTVTVSGFTDLAVNGTVQVGSNGVLVVTNGLITMTNLVIQDGGTLQAYNSTSVVNGVEYTGDFTLDENWDVAMQAQPIDYSETFENYTPGAELRSLLFYGWNASSAGAVVAANPDGSGNASAKVALVPTSVTLSNLVDGVHAGLTNLWTDLLIRVTERTDRPELVDTNGGRAVQFVVNTNGYLTILTPGGWEVCDKDVPNNDAPTIGTNEWARISWFMDFGATSAAFFVKGQLVRQGVAFANPASAYRSLRVDAMDATGWVDAVTIRTTAPAALLTGSVSDLDDDGIPDATEVQNFGSTTLYPRGSVFKIR